MTIPPLSSYIIIIYFKGEKNHGYRLVILQFATVSMNILTWHFSPIKSTTCYYMMEQERGTKKVESLWHIRNILQWNKNDIKARKVPMETTYNLYSNSIFNIFQKGKRVSKVRVLQKAIDYITNLHNMIQECDGLPSNSLDRFVLNDADDSILFAF